MVGLLEIPPCTVISFVCVIIFDIYHPYSYACHSSHHSVLVLMVINDLYHISDLEQSDRTIADVVLDFHRRDAVFRLVVVYHQ